ncbi:MULTISPECIES: DMT family transporter [unclassified Halobacteriovorax]|uniref:DMT family transporter n=1 Tax=unclassified Halobacteriovorax TaxID=2639665 RepID=UPI00399C4281
MKGIILLSIACAIWGLGFAGTRFTLTDYSPVWSNSLRYIFAGSFAFVILFFRNDFKKLAGNKKEVMGGLICSALLMMALQLQTVGIAMTTMAKAGFFTVFYAIITPIISVLFLGQRVRKTFWLLLSTSMLGIMMMNGMDFSNFNMGDIFVIASAVFFSLHIIATDRYANDVEAVRFNFLQCIFMGLMGLVFALIYEGPTSLSVLYTNSPFNFPSPLWGFLILSIFSSLIAFSLQITAQRSIPAHIVGLVFLSESIFAALFGYILFGETLDPTAIAGSVVIVISVALVPKFTNIRKDESESEELLENTGASSVVNDTRA